MTRHGDDTRAAYDAMRNHYWKVIRGIVDDLRGELGLDDLDDIDLSDDRTQEELGYLLDCECTYTSDIMAVLFASSNADAYHVEFGEIPVQDGQVDFGAMAYWALQTDVCEQIESENRYNADKRAKHADDGGDA